MVPSRIATAYQAVAVPIILHTSAVPAQVWWGRGNVQVSLGVIYSLVALYCFIRPLGLWTEPVLAAVGVTFWTLRAIVLFTVALHPPPGLVSLWPGVVVYSGMALFVGLYYYRSIFRLGFLTRHRELEDEIQRGG